MAFLSDSESWREWLEVVFSSIFFAFSANCTFCGSFCDSGCGEC